MFRQQELKLRATEEIIIEDLWSIFKPVFGKGKLLLQVGSAYLTNERFYFTTVKKAMATKHFVKSFDYSKIAYIRRARYDQKSGYLIVSKNGERHTFAIGKLGLRRLWIQKIRNYVKK